jgi:hypothetical protein
MGRTVKRWQEAVPLIGYPNRFLTVANRTASAECGALALHILLRFGKKSFF